MNMKVRAGIFAFLLFSLGSCATAFAQVTLPRILSSHMVVERDLPVHVWGLAPAGEQVSVTFRGETRSTTAGPLGRWSVYLAPGAAGGPFQMTVKGAAAEQVITLDGGTLRVYGNANVVPKTVKRDAEYRKIIANHTHY